MMLGLIDLTTSDDSAIDEGCKFILQLWFEKVTEKKDLKIKIGGEEITGRHLLLMRNQSDANKRIIEESYFYVKFRMLWMMGNFLDGKVPHVNMTGIKLCNTRYRKIVEDIADFLTSDDVCIDQAEGSASSGNRILSEFIDYDASAFFRTITKLFIN